jgi:nitrogen fixation/metabolism regulation signal transduction histidine kinase
VPTVLVLIVGSELIRTNIDRWFNAPMADILSSANQIASDYYREQQMLASDHANRLARTLAGIDLTNADVRPIRDLLAPDVTLQRVQMVEVYRVVPPAGRCRARTGDRRRRAVAAGRLQPRRGDRLAAQALAGSTETKSIETLGAPAICCTRRPSSARGRQADGVVVATAYLTGDLAARSRRMTQAFERLQPAARAEAAADRRVPVVLPDGDAADSVRRDLDGLVLAKRITRPVLMLRPRRARSAPAARSAVEPQSNDEFGSLVEAFNSMARELATSRRKVDRGTIRARAQARRGRRRRRYIETILERIATGVVSVDASARSRRSTAPRRGCSAWIGRSSAAGARGLRSRRSAAARRAAGGAGPAAASRRARDRAGARRAGAASGGRGDAARRRQRRLEGVVLVLDE